MRVFDAAATREALPFGALIDALQQAFVQGAEVPARHVHTLAAVPGGLAAQPNDLTSLLMPAWQPGGLYGVKVVNVAPGNAARGMATVQASYLLFDAVTGAPLAVMDGAELTARRTAAASALAAKLILGVAAATRARQLLVLGAGRVAELLPQAYAAAMPLASVRVWARKASEAEKLALALKAMGLPAEAAAPDLAEAVARAEIVSCATLATEPLVSGAWLRPGSHLDLIGSFTPQMREADDAAFAGAALFVDTDEALAKSGDLLGPLARGVIQAGDVQARLQQLCRGERLPPRPPGQRTVFKSVGTALEDLAAAGLVWARASQPQATAGAF
jgi:ornithine cyclodeaminase/alanine dehydrogenase-like protein (mu-crystallin family)